MARLEQPKTYPYTEAFLVTQLPLLPTAKPTVFGLFRDYTGLTPEESQGILLRQYKPMIKVTQTPPGTYGWTPATGDRIWLNAQFITDFESLLSGRTDISSGPWTAYQDQRFKEKQLIPKLRILLEVTVMHELVHFGRRLVHGYNPNRAAEERVAQAFEIKAYGKIHTVTSLGISHIVPEPK